jgi:hypothetical protein
MSSATFSAKERIDHRMRLLMTVVGNMSGQDGRPATGHIGPPNPEILSGMPSLLWPPQSS